MSEYNKIVLDGLNVSHRFHWIHQKFSYNGILTGMLHGVMNYVVSLKRDNPKAKIMFCWDSQRLLKKEKYKNYKADREKQKNNFYDLIKILKNLLSLYGIDQYLAIGYEADDIAARICKKFFDEKILLVSNDSDWILMMNNNVDIYKSNKIWSYQEYLEYLEVGDKEEFQIMSAITGTHNNVSSAVPNIRKAFVKEFIEDAKNDLDRMFKLKSDKYNQSRINWLEKIKKEEEIIRSNYEIIEHLTSGYKVRAIKKRKNKKDLKVKLEKYGLVSVMKRLGMKEYE